MAITHKHAFRNMLSNEVSRLQSALQGRQERQQSTARTGSPNLAPRNGSYDADGNWQPYLRLDVDDFDSGKGCAP